MLEDLAAQAVFVDKETELTFEGEDSISKLGKTQNNLVSRCRKRGKGIERTEGIVVRMKLGLPLG